MPVRSPRLPAAFLLIALSGCGGGGSSNDPGTPAAPATPAPAPTPTPNPYAAACGTPLPNPADVWTMGLKVQLEPTRNKKVLAASPQIRNAEYCNAAGILHASICSTRLEDNPQRVPCDHYVAGTSESGRPGPDWYQDVNGRLLKCGGVNGVPTEAPNCFLKPENQYLLDVYAGGQYVACTGSGVLPRVCSGCLLFDSDFGVIHRTPAGLCRPS